MQFASIFSQKAKNWCLVRRNWEVDLSQKIKPTVNYCWIHCASAGEFEQAIPLINRIKNQESRVKTKIAVSFFSSSGFELYKDSNLADLFFYFPLDTKNNAKKLIEILQPTFVIFIRNEIWFNILSALKNKQIPTFLVNANLQQKRNFFYTLFLKKAYSLFSTIFDTKTCGNTKLVRVIENKNVIFNNEVLKDFCKDSFVIILGSSWLKEEEFIIEFYKKNKSKISNLKIIIAPHENLSINIFKLKQCVGDVLSFYSKYKSGKILILDKKGILKYAYRYADIAFIGGGFGNGVHNVTEAAVYGIPTVFGTNYAKFEEVNELVNLQLAFPVNNYTEFEVKLIEFINNSGKRNDIKNKLTAYFSSHATISENIVEEMLKL